MKPPNPAYLHACFRSERNPPWPDRFAVVTACNPQGRTIDAPQNSRLDSELAYNLSAAAFPFWRVVGGDAEFVHTEPG